MNNPLESNPNWKQVFKLQSQMSDCFTTEVVELYKNKKDNNEWAIFRFRFRDNSFPLKIVHKFTNLISGEYIEKNGEYNLTLNTLYKDNVVSQSFNACCGSKLWVSQVERALYDNLL